MAKALVERAREFRQGLTKTEAALWAVVRGRALGVRFYRQHVIGPFIADFASERPKLVVEIDGPVHEQHEERDRLRQEWLEGQGYRVLRFRTDEVESDLGSVVARLRDALALRAT